MKAFTSTPESPPAFSIQKPLLYFSILLDGVSYCTTKIDSNTDSNHGVPKGGQKEKKLSGFGAYIFGIGIPRGLVL